MLPVPPLACSQAWTAGAQRAFLRAACMAHALQADAVEPVHLLWALVWDEGHAGTRLAGLGLNPDSLQRQLGLPLLPATIDESPPPSLPWADAALSAAVAALSMAFEQQPHSEASTDHLLWSLCQPPLPTAELLRQCGLEASAWKVGQAGIAAEDTAPVPLPPDQTLRLREPATANPSDMYRLLDAAANRAREGLRVLEDYVRFVWNDQHLARLCKECRHDLASILAELPTMALLSARNTLDDVGTRVATAAEYQRSHPFDVLIAASKRTGEALRSLEEFGKVLNSQLGQRCEQLRYRLYTLEKAILRTGYNRERLAEQRLYLLLTEELCPRGAGPVLHAALEAGVRMVQIREKRMADRELVERCRWARRVTRQAEALLIINDRPDIAVVVEADGVHVGQSEFTIADARKIVGPDRLVGVSTHTLEQARQAVLEGADYLGVGPTFQSQTKHFNELAGVEFVRQVAAEITLPWFAIGGITVENVGQARSAGAERVAVSAAICAAEDPALAVSELLAQL